MTKRAFVKSEQFKLSTPEFISQYSRNFILISLRFIDSAGLRKVDRGLKMLSEPI